MGLLSALIVPDMAAAILVVPTFLTNVWQAFAGPYTWAVLRRFWPMYAGVFMGTLLTAGIITGADPGIAALPIGGVLLVYAALGLSGVRFRVPRRSEVVTSPAMGLTTGLINGATAIFVLPGAPYLQARIWTRTSSLRRSALSGPVCVLRAGLGIRSARIGRHGGRRAVAHGAGRPDGCHARHVGRSGRASAAFGRGISALGVCRPCRPGRRDGLAGARLARPTSRCGACAGSGRRLPRWAFRAGRGTSLSHRRLRSGCRGA